jgi:hypothetical protein
MEPPGRQRPGGRAGQGRLAAEEVGRARDVEMDALRSGRSLEADDRREAAAPPRDPPELGHIAGRIVGDYLGDVARTGAMGERQHGHALGQGRARRNVLPALSAGKTRRPRPGPRHDPHHAAPLPAAHEHRHPPQLRPREQPLLHGPARQPDRHDARHDTPPGGTLPAAPVMNV